MKKNKLKMYEKLISNKTITELEKEKKKLLIKKEYNDIRRYKLPTIIFGAGSLITISELYNFFEADEVNVFRLIAGALFLGTSFLGFYYTCNEIELTENKLSMINDKINYYDEDLKKDKCNIKKY